MTDQFPPRQLLEWAREAEDSGFEGHQVSEHFQPWTPQHGQAAFAWSFLGALGMVTQSPITLAVTCIGFRYHPAVVAHAAATVACMFPGRFRLGLGTGEALNEHVVGAHWPDIRTRSLMMFEGLAIIRRLIAGERLSHHGAFFTVDGARLYSRPDLPVPIYVASSGPRNARRTGQVADGFITAGSGTQKLAGLLDSLAQGARDAGRGATALTRQLHVHVSWAETRDEAEGNALRHWPNGGMPFPKQDIRDPEAFEQMARLVQPEHFKDRVLINPDLDAHAAALQAFINLGFDELYLHNVGPNQSEFIRAFGRRVLPQLVPGSTAGSHVD